MNKKKCEYCGNEYDENLNKCPFCTVDIADGLVDISRFSGIKRNEESNGSIIVNKSIISNNSIIMEPSIEDDDDEYDYELQDKINIIDRRNESVKNSNNKKNNNSNSTLFSYLLLIMGMILLFIIVFSSILELNIVPLVHYGLTVLFLFIAFNFVYKKKEHGYLISILASISMILMIYESDYISSIIGIYLFISSFRYLIKK